MNELRTAPLPVMTLDEAIEVQFRLVDILSRHLSDGRSLTEGDLGMVEPLGRPLTTATVEGILAEFFEVEDAALVIGSGTGAIRAAFFAAFAPGSEVVVHDAPIYHTTSVTIRSMGIQPVRVDLNRLPSSLERLPRTVRGALVQHSRQRPDDHYDLGQVIGHLRAAIGDAPIVTDDNYAVLKVPRIGAQLGADLSTFSAFKLLGPNAVGGVVGRRALIDVIREHNRSGGLQVQGPEAMAVLRGLVFVPVAAAIQARVAASVAERLRKGEVPGVTDAAVANSEETVVLLRLDRPVARAVIAEAVRLGAAPRPVGAESRYELAPMFYRVSKGMLSEDPSLADTMIRVNPYRGGEEQIIRLLRDAIAACA